MYFGYNQKKGRQKGAPEKTTILFAYEKLVFLTYHSFKCITCNVCAFDCLQGWAQI